MLDLNFIGILIIGLLGSLLLLGMPIGLALAAAGLSGLWLTRGPGATEFLIGTFSYSYTANFAYIVLPLFLFMGHMAFAGGISQRAFDAAERIIGHISGGLAIATVFACAAFAMICGSSVATASTMARVSIPEMLKRKYSPALAAGSVAAGGTLGVLIPPSGVLVIYSIATQVSIVDLFLAALVPGFMTAAIYCIGIYLMVKFKPSLAPAHKANRYSAREKAVSVLRSWEVLLLFGAVMGSIYLGVATPTEAAALGALLATIGAMVKNKNRWVVFSGGLRETGYATASIFLLILGAGIFSLGLSTTKLPTLLADWMIGLSDSRYVTLAMVLIPYFILGMFIDGISMILLTMPITYPIIVKLGFDPVWFGIVVTKLVEIGVLTPPVGLNAFVVKNSVPSLSLAEVFKGCLPFVILETLIVVILVIFPELTSFGR